MPTNQLAPLVNTIWINLAGNSFQVIMEMGMMEMEMGLMMAGLGLMMAAPPYFLMVMVMVTWRLVLVDSCNYEIEATQPSFLMVMIAQQLLPLIFLLIL